MIFCINKYIELADALPTAFMESGIQEPSVRE